MQNVQDLIKNTDSLTYLNSLKVCVIELKEELTTIKDCKSYQDAAVERAERIIRRIDNQYRAIVKAAQGQEVREDMDIEETEDLTRIMEAAPGE